MITIMTLKEDKCEASTRNSSCKDANFVNCNRNKQPRMQEKRGILEWGLVHR